MSWRFLTKFMEILTFLTFLIHSTWCELDRRVITSLKYSAYRVKPTIVNGFPVCNEKVPFLVSIKEASGKLVAGDLLWSNLCGGSIIGQQKVLTAAHCFEGNNFLYAKSPHLLRVFAGSNRTFIIHSGATDTTSDLQVRQVESPILNKNFQFPSNDIAIFYVNVPFNFTDSVNSIVPAKMPLDYHSTCITAGYGKTGYDFGDRDSHVLLIANIHVLTRWECATLWQMKMNTFVCTDDILADVARGDSGGPLACSGTGDPAEVSGKLLLVGVVSGKNFDKTTLFTRVSAYHDWIEKDFACRLTPTLFLIISILLIYLLFLYT